MKINPVKYINTNFSDYGLCQCEYFLAFLLREKKSPISKFTVNIISFLSFYDDLCIKHKYEWGQIMPYHD